MQYFVNVENTSYFYWQLELLIESMLIQGVQVQDNLVIAFSENDCPKIKDYSKNIVKYGIKTFFPNIGRQTEHLQANRIYTLQRLVKEGILKPPFTVLHSDMIMKNPIDSYNKPFDFVVNNYDISNEDVEKYFDDENNQKNIMKENETIDNVSIFKELKSYAPIIFNESLDPEFLEKFLTKLVLNVRSLIESKGPEFPCEKVAWKKTFLEAVGHYTATGETLACDLLQPDVDVPFIHYNRGIPPVFNKLFFKFEKPSLYYDGPFENLLQQNISETTNFVHQVIKSYIKRARY
jgi:hypothetical protein